MSQQATRTCRVAQWATGNIGTHAMKAVIRHPQMQLAGLRVHSEICRLLESGVNSVTSVVEFHDPESLAPEVRTRV